MSIRRVVLACLVAYLSALAVLPACAEDHLTLGVFPRRNAAETTRMFTPIAERLGAQLGRRVSVVTSRDFESFWRGVTERRYDIIHYNQYHYIRSSDAYEVIAHIEEGGKSTIAGAIFVRKDSGITSLAQLKGRTVLFGGGEDAMVSYIANRYLMLQAGLKKEDFKSLFAVNPPNSIVGVYHRQADAAGAGDVGLELPMVKKTINIDELKTLALSEQLLQLPIVAKRDMPLGMRRAIQAVLLGLKDSEEGRYALKTAALTGIGKAEDKDYEPHRKIVRAVFGPAEASGK